MGVDVVGVDINEQAVKTISSGAVHIIEPDLDMLVRAAVSTGKLRAVSAPEKAYAFIIAVPTPVATGHTPDLSYIESAARSIAPVLDAGNLVILESTAPVGTGRSSPAGSATCDRIWVFRIRREKEPTSASPTARNAFFPGG